MTSGVPMKKARFDQIRKGTIVEIIMPKGMPKNVKINTVGQIVVDDNGRKAILFANNKKPLYVSNDYLLKVV